MIAVLAAVAFPPRKLVEHLEVGVVGGGRCRELTAHIVVSDEMPSVQVVDEVRTCVVVGNQVDDVASLALAQDELVGVSCDFHHTISLNCSISAWSALPYLSS